MSLFSLQFSSSSDILASLMRIPQYFLPECLHAENTQVCAHLHSVYTISSYRNRNVVMCFPYCERRPIPLISIHVFLCTD